ncbi:MAG: hypothetical protein HOP08_15425 [Cyclobacteriaceae bacterium]|nr:hypothetical protein [Cyclobacteriaceae bacterium]
MKNLRNGFLAFGVVIATLLSSCDSKEKAQLHNKVDSLTVELNQRKEVEKTMTEVGSLLDSIDANRHALRTKMIEGTSYAEYVSRLKDINNHISATQKKIDELQKTADKNRVTAGTIKRLKADLASRSEEITALQLEIVTMRDQNANLWAKVNSKDSLLSIKDEVIKVKESDVASLEGLVTDINEQNRNKVASMYYAQAQALETAAERTKFAPRKKKETRREALELYRLSLSMGNTEAQARIDALEKELS